MNVGVIRIRSFSIINNGQFKDCVISNLHLRVSDEVFPIEEEMDPFF